MIPRKLKCEYTKETLEDITHEVSKKGNMIQFYEYKTNNESEIAFIKKLAKIDYENSNHLIYSITNKQLRQYKLGAIEGIKKYVKIKNIIFNSKIVNIERIFELNLSKDLCEEIDKEILKNVIKLGNKK